MLTVLNQFAKNVLVGTERFAGMVHFILRVLPVMSHLVL